ncbi:MAG: acyl-CoA thioesterase [Planctomycetaceae bacterium]|nr:acyl-CoA thioesterase [Planctomycetaceae bacterium]
MAKAWKTVITPGFGDADPLRHINNCRLPVWFEEGRIPLFKVFHPSLDLDTWPLILARISVDYIAQMRWDAEVEILTYIKKFGRSSLTVYQEAYQDNRLSAKGETVLVHFDYATQKSKPIPPDIAAILQAHLIEPDNPNLRTRSGRLPAAGL